MFIYIHVPFCASRCIYCDFYVVLHKHGGPDAGQVYTDAVCREIALRFETLDLPACAPIQSIYTGGGTPSLLSAKNYRQIFETLAQFAPLASNPEITLEANPLHMQDTPGNYPACGFNRVSVGIQSLNNDELKRLSRAHSAEQAMAFIHVLQQAGFKNISIDLMYGLPGQTFESWQKTLQQAITLGVQHVSMYGLKVEDNTPLARLQAFERYQPPGDETTVEMYFQGVEVLEAAGFSLYEFSNLAKPGFASRHNLNYWDNGDYLALGVSAHGYVQNVRYETVRDLKAYLLHPTQGEYRPCPPAEQLENALIFGLRKLDGVNIRSIEARYQINFRKCFGHIIDKYSALGMMEESHGRLRLTRQAIPVSNTILADFLA